MACLKPHGHGGLTPQEERIMDLWDDGRSAREIHTRTGIPARTVSKAVTMYHSDADDGRERRMLAQGSARLLAAIERARIAA
jgi:hypothetical protein